MSATFPARLAAWTGARLQRKLVVTLVLVLALVSAAFLGVVSNVYRARMTSEHARASLQVNALLQAALENAMLKRDIPGLHAILGDIAHHEDIARAFILNPAMEIRFASDPALEHRHLDDPEIRAALSEQRQRVVLVEEDGRPAVLRSINPVHNQPVCTTCHGPLSENPVNGLLVVDYAAGAIGREARSTALMLGGIGMAVIGATALAVWAAVTRLIVSPLRQLTAGTQALGAGDLGHRIATGGGRDEIAALGESFNRMTARLQDTLARLRGSEAFLQSVIDAIPDGIRVIGRDFRIVKANAAYAAHVGQDLAAIPGAPCHRSSHGRDAPCPDTLVCCPVAELRAGRRETATCRQTHRGPAGEDIHVEVAFAAVEIEGEDGPVPCVVEAIRDLEQQARISQQHRLSELGLLAAGLAHEIHNPLSSIELTLSAMQEDMSAGRAGELAPRLATIRGEVRRTLAITDSLLMLCLPPAADPVLIELDRVVPEALAILAFQARKTGAEIACDIAPGLRILGSDSDVRMLVTNLVLNALHAMPAGGRVAVTGRAEAGEVRLAVADTGHGIAPRDLARIFLPFWTRRADSTTGCGLGLSIVQAIVERAGGRIAVESALGRGSTFTAVFPDPDAPPQESPA